MTTRVLVLGAGFGGLELSSRLAAELGDRVQVTLIDRGDAFVFGFTKLDVLIGRRSPASVRLPYADLTWPSVTFRRETVTAIDPVARRVTTDAGTHEADVLVIALGAGYDLAATPGLAELGHEFYSVPGVERAVDTVAAFRSGRLVVGVCGNPYKCPPAPSEAALLLNEVLRERGVRDAVSIDLVIPSPRPVGPSKDASARILETFAARGITFHPDRRVTALDAATHDAVLDDGTRLPFDLFLGVPVHVAPPVVVDAGLTENGWIPVDRRTLATRHPGVYAVGDVANAGTTKAGVFAERQAAAVAAAIIAEVRGEAAPAGFDGTGACWIEYGKGEIGRVDVDFFQTPGTPVATYTPPSDRTRSEKAEFAGARRTRWFGPGIG
jgi:sulfide:quinone oxidoreductase